MVKKEKGTLQKSILKKILDICTLTLKNKIASWLSSKVNQPSILKILVFLECRRQKEH